MSHTPDSARPAAADGPGDRPGEDVVLVTISVPDEATGDRIATVLVEDRLAACVKRSGPVRSVYRWQGVVEQADEWVLSCVTTLDRFDEFAAAVGAVHPYDVPEVVATPVVAGSEDYLAWVRGSSSAD